MKPSASLSFFALLALLAAPAFAQDYYKASEGDRVDRLERDLMLLQRQIARGEPVTPITDGDVAMSGGPAGLEVRLSAIEEEMRNIRGKLEEAEFQNRKLSESLDKMQRDVDFRFNELATGKPSAAATPSAASEPAPLPPSEAAASEPAPPPGETTAGDGVLEAPGEKTDQFATPRDLYNYGFRLLNQTQYEQAAATFKNFTQKYPKDPLVGNAYYWLGETHYIRRDYTAAADSFRQGFEVLPTGPKSADNLLKLSMSLNALERNEEACVVLKQITTKFKKSSTTITAKADQEQKRIGCK